MFYGLTSLDTLYLHENTIDSLEMTVSLEKVAGRGFGAFRAIAPTAAPFDMRLPIRITNGRIVGGATALTIPQGSVESETFTVIRTPGTNAAVTADIGTFPRLPERHSGYALLKSTDLPPRAYRGGPGLTLRLCLVKAAPRRALLRRTRFPA